MKLKMLITAWEAVNNFPGSNKFETSKVNPLINDIEEGIFRKCFSVDIYEKMILDVNYNSSSPYPDWDKSVIYNELDYVFYQGLLYQLDGQATSIAQPPITNQGFWIKQSKFGNANYNTWWNKYLLRYLSYMVMIPAVHYATVKVEPGGLMKVVDTNTGISSVGVKDLFDWKQQANFDADTILENMTEWFKVCGISEFANFKILNNCNDVCQPETGNYFYFGRSLKKDYIR